MRISHLPTAVYGAWIQFHLRTGSAKGCSWRLTKAHSWLDLVTVVAPMDGTDRLPFESMGKLSQAGDNRGHSFGLSFGDSLIPTVLGVTAESTGQVMFQNEAGGPDKRWGGTIEVPVRYGDNRPRTQHEITCPILEVRGRSKTEEIRGVIEGLIPDLPPKPLGEYRLTVDP